MLIIYKSPNEATTLMQLDTLLANFRMSGVKHWEDDIRDQLDGLGWYEGMHDYGRYIIIDPRKLGCEPLPTMHDAYAEQTGERKERCTHRDDGRGRCIDCGEFI